MPRWTRPAPFPQGGRPHALRGRPWPLKRGVGRTSPPDGDDNASSRAGMPARRRARATERLSLITGYAACGCSLSRYLPADAHCMLW